MTRTAVAFADCSLVNQGGNSSCEIAGNAIAFMAEIVNLRMARKRVKRQREQERAAQARVSHGVSKTDRAQVESEKQMRLRHLDAHRIETGESDEIAGR
jgi:hypothetical protein